MTTCNTNSAKTVAEHTFTQKTNQFLSKFSYWIVGIVIAILGSIYTATIERIDTLENRVTFLYQDKVSKEELRNITTELRQQSERDKADIMSQQNAMKSDILSRLDYLLRIYPPSSPAVNNTNTR